ncbi:MAG: hypothetical protein ACYC2E_10380, partial [Sulfuricella sp.]
APRFLPTIGHPHAVALRFVRCGQLTGGLPPPRLRPCWAHIKKAGRETRPAFFCPGIPVPDQARITEKKLIQLQTIKVTTTGSTNLAIYISLIKNPPKTIL